MSARIRITRGINAGTTHEIHVNFLRVGSDLSCDFCIPSAEVPPVAILVEYIESSRSYSVHCRSEDACYFNGRLMNPGDKRDWTAGQELAIGRTLGLELELDADPSPTPPDTRRERQQQFIDHQIQDAALAEDASLALPTGGTVESSTDPSVLIKIGVIVLCIVVSILAIAYRAGAFDSFGGPKDEPIPTTEQVRAELEGIDAANPYRNDYLRLFEQAKNPVRARESYTNLRVMILKNEEVELDKTLRYVNDRLKNLSGVDE